MGKYVGVANVNSLKRLMVIVVICAQCQVTNDELLTEDVFTS